MEKDLAFYFSQLQRHKRPKTFEQVYRLSSVRLFGVVLRILKTRELAEDCLQEVYVKIWNRSDAYNPKKSSAMTWMSTIARNHAIDYVRKHELPIQEGFEMSIIQDEQLHFLDRLEASELDQQLQECLKQLKVQSREVIFMAYFNGLTYKHIAKTIDTPVSTIKTWVARALPILKKCLERIHA